VARIETEGIIFNGILQDIQDNIGIECYGSILIQFVMEIKEIIFDGIQCDIKR